MLARAAALIIEPGYRDELRRTEIEERLLPLVAQGGPAIVFQPIVRLRALVITGAEALSRFPAAWQRPPDVVFHEAHSIGVGHHLELRALERAAAQAADFAGYIGMNLSPAALLEPEAMARLQQLPLDRILLELSEHEAVDDYDALQARLAPLREQGLRLAIDDVGAGFSSLRHIVLTRPDVIKLDRSIVAGAAHDPVLATLAESLVGLARQLGAQTVAEGIETQADADCLLSLGVDLGQGWLFGRPSALEEWAKAAG